MRRLPSASDAVALARAREARHTVHGLYFVFVGPRRTRIVHAAAPTQGRLVLVWMERFSGQKLQEIKRLPWEPNPGAEGREEKVGQIRLDPELPEVPAGPPEVFEPKAVYRSHYIVRADLAKYGFTSGCPACEETRAGRKRRGGILHTQACRERIEAAIAADPERRQRLEATNRRFDEKVARTIDEHERKKQRLAEQEEEERRKREAADPEGRESKRIREEPPRGTTRGADAVAGSSHDGPQGNPDKKRREDAALEPREDTRMEARESRKREQPEAPDDEDMGRLAELVSRGVSSAVHQAERALMSVMMEINQAAKLADQERNPDEPVPEEPCAVESSSHHVDQWRRYYDTVTGVELDSTKVQEAMREEVAAMEKMGVWRRVNPKEMRHDTKVVPTKWVLVNKGDADHVEIRARLVACEVKGAAESEPTLFAATPPLDALRCLISLAASRRGEVLDFVDIRKAHLNGRARREIYVKLPKEAGGGPAILERSLYGTRDAAACWEACVAGSVG